MKKQLSRCLPMLALACVVTRIEAQPAVEASVGFGTAFNKTGGGGIENASSATPFAGCSTAAGTNDGFCQSTPTLGGLFMNLAGDVMLTNHFGAAIGVTFQPSKRDYGPLLYRQSFVDGNLLYAPVAKKRWEVQLLGGLGTARTSFSLSQTGCIGTSVLCTTQTLPVGSDTHFQLHGGAGVELFLTEHIFVRPQLDLHYVPNLNQQFGNNLTPAATISIGYSSRDRD